MGYYSDYLNKQWDFNQLTVERKKQLKRISELRGDRDIIVYGSDATKNTQGIIIDYNDILPFQDQLSNLNGNSLDIILETPGGFAEVVEDLVRLIRKKYEKVGIIIPGSAKSAGTIFAMAGDEILMGSSSSLGPIDAQIYSNNKRFSAEAFLEGLEKIKKEVLSTGKLNPAYIPILQNISPGEIQHCENAQNFSKILVTQWLSEYKFKFWAVHSSTNQPVTKDDKKERANQIADKLCRQSEWLTHGRSIKIEEFELMKLKITDFSKNAQLNEAIMRYYTLLKMSFETNMYKLFETIDSQIYRFALNPQMSPVLKKLNEIADINFECPNCHSHYKIQANVGVSMPIKPGHLPYPLDNDIFRCPNCQKESNIGLIRLQIEAQSGKKVVK
jgi:hypothetical protein